jgi:hypothetical protein
MLSKGLGEKFNFDCTVRSNKGKKVIVISNNTYPIFYDLVIPYILPAASLEV